MGPHGHHKTCRVVWLCLPCGCGLASGLADASRAPAGSGDKNSLLSNTSSSVSVELVAVIEEDELAARAEATQPAAPVPAGFSNMDDSCFVPARCCCGCTVAATGCCCCCCCCCFLICLIACMLPCPSLSSSLIPTLLLVLDRCRRCACAMSSSS